MGNSKNRKNYRNKHRYVYKKKKLPWMEKQPKNRHTNLRNREQNAVPDFSMQSSRIIDLDKLQEYTDDLVNHSSQCEGSINLVSETRNGLASVFTGCCSLCQHTINLTTSKKVKGPQGINRYRVHTNYLKIL